MKIGRGRGKEEGRGERTDKSRCFMPPILSKHVYHWRKHRETQEKEERYSQMLNKYKIRRQQRTKRNP